MKSILHIRSSYTFGGPERQIMHYCQEFAQRKIDSAVASFVPRRKPATNRFLPRVAALGFEAYPIKIRGSFDRSAIAQLTQLALDKNFDMIVTHDYRADFIGRIVARKVGLPIVSFAHGWTKVTLRVKIYEWLDLRVLKRVDGIVAVSKAKRRELIDWGISSDKVVYIPNSIPLVQEETPGSLIRDRLGVPEDAFLVGTVGRLSIEKNQETFIAAALRVLESEDKPIYFLLVGDGVRKPALQSLVPDKWRGRILFTGWIDNIDAIYRNLDIFALTSLTEGFPMVLLEAGKHSIPVITTSVGGIPEIIEDESSGLIMPVGDSDALADSIVRLYGDESGRRRLAANLNVKVRDNFSTKKGADLLLAFLQRVLEERR